MVRYCTVVESVSVGIPASLGIFFGNSLLQEEQKAVRKKDLLHFPIGVKKGSSAQGAGRLSTGTGAGTVTVTVRPVVGGGGGGGGE